MDGVKVTKLINGPGGVHARQRVLPRRDRGRAASSSAPASAPTASPAPAGSARSWPSGSPTASRASTSGTWTSAASAPSTARPPTPTRGSRRPTRPTTTSATPNHERAGRAAAAGLAGQRLAPRARRRLRREVRLGAGQLVRVERRAPGTRRCGRAAGRASTGRRRSAPSTARRARPSRSSTSPRSPSSRSRGPGAAAFLERLCDNRVARERRRRSPTRRCSTAAAGSSATSPSPAWARSASRSSPAPPSATTTASGCAATCPATASVDVVDDVTSQWACFGIWGPRAREVLQPLTPQDLGNEAFPYMSLREITVGNVPVRALRVTYVGELGWELYCPTEYGLGLWRALWEAGEPHGIVAGGYRAIDSLRLEKGYRVWGADITPDETPYEGGLGFCVKLDKDGGFIGREALAEAKERGPRIALCLPRPRGPALGRARQRAGAGRRRDRRPGDDRRLRLHRRALDRLRLPAARRRRAGHGGRGRDLRPLGRGRGRARAALRPRRASASAPSPCACRRCAPGCDADAGRPA